MKYTTVITSFNRRHCICLAIDSALREMPDHEVVVVDDASTDGTPELIKECYGPEIEQSKLKLICLHRNIGVTGAKNQGYIKSTGDWVIFLDSDDYYESGVGKSVVTELKNSAQAPIVFFRCKTQSGQFVGEHEGQRLVLELKDYIKYTSFGEALTAINKTLVKQSLPYVQSLRGYEGIGCARFIRDFGPAVLSDVVARIYITTGKDRLSVDKGFLLRLPLLAKGHFQMTREFHRDVSLRQKMTLLVKALVYCVVGNFYLYFKK